MTLELVELIRNVSILLLIPRVLSIPRYSRVLPRT